MSKSTKAVFLSYASQDADAAQRICEVLRAAGLEVWFDQSDLRGGDAWDAAIRKQVKECAARLRSRRTQGCRDVVGTCVCRAIVGRLAQGWPRRGTLITKNR